MENPSGCGIEPPGSISHGVRSIGMNVYFFAENMLFSVRNVLLPVEICREAYLGATWSPRDPRFAGSNPAEVDGFFRM